MHLQITTPDGRTTTTPLAFAAGLSDPVPIPGTRLDVRVAASAAVGDTWLVEHRALPTPDLGAVAANLEAVGADVILALFGPAPEEPYKTWKALWDSDKPLPYRLGAVLLALARRTDELRAAGGG